MTIEAGAVVAIAVFMLGVAYYAGRLSARLDGVERRIEVVENGAREILDALGRLPCAVGREDKG